MITFVNAKINLGLRVLRRLPSGYHELETIFYPIGIYNGTPDCPYPFCDIIEVTSGHQLYDLTVTGWENAPAAPDNLISRAYMLFTEECRRNGIPYPIMNVTLDKHLPSQAGMGGGSADASAALQLFNTMAGKALSDDTLSRLAMSLGADCPFFLYNKPALGKGTGEILTPVQEKLKGLWCAIIKPQEDMPTAKAFKMISPTPEGNLPSKIYNQDISTWHQEMINDFEKPFLSLYPHCAKIKEHLYAHGALYASLTGSGAAFYGIFNNREEAVNAIESANQPYTAIALL